MKLSATGSKASCSHCTGLPLFGPSARPNLRWRSTSSIIRPAVAARAWFKSLPTLLSPEVQTDDRPVVRQGGKPDGKAIITRYYEAYNQQDYETMEAMLAPDVVWHDMGLYEEPFQGRDQVMAFKRKISSQVPDFKFVIDDITSSDPNKVGLVWHVEVQPGIAFPFSRGCSFCTFNDQGQITYARDLVEAPSKPGDNGIVLLRALVPLIRKLGPAADPANLKNLPIAAAAVWAFYAGYTAHIMFSTTAPGLPALSQPPEVLQEVFNESLNFFYVNIALDQLGLTPIPSVASPPVSEALFNFVAAWGVLFLPVMLTEKESKKVGNTWAWWTGIMFLTNVFFIPFLALRAAPSKADESVSPSTTAAPAAPAAPYPGWTQASTILALGMGLFSLWWAVGGRPEYGDIQARLDYFTNEFSTNRVFYAFVIDSVLYSVWQAVLLGGVPSATPAQRSIPFFGLVQHLLTAPREVPAAQDKA